MDYNQRIHEAPYSFSGHESFALRYAWLPKTVQGLLAHPDLFDRADDLVILGVGKNMVRSMRHWCMTLGLIEPTKRGVPDTPSELGVKLFGKDGWDPYLEDPGTLWFLHWRLVHSPERASAWFLVFSQFAPVSGRSFTRNELVDWLVERSEERAGTRATRNSIKRDVDVLLRTYVPTEPKATNPPEDSFDSPLAELGLIYEIRAGEYQLDLRDKPTLTSAVFEAALLEYWCDVAPNQLTLRFESVAHGLGSPGAAFRLPENDLVERLEHLPAQLGIRFDETAGMRQLIRVAHPPTPMDILRGYYRP